MTTSPDPPVPADGSCVVCHGPRRFSKLKPLYRAALAQDPFCSNECARTWHGTTLGKWSPGSPAAVG